MRHNVRSRFGWLRWRGSPLLKVLVAFAIMLHGPAVDAARGPPRHPIAVRAEGPKALKIPYT
eukprot:7038015-Pyramimonas_sp.AAC.1